MGFGEQFSIKKHKILRCNFFIGCHCDLQVVVFEDLAHYFFFNFPSYIFNKCF